MANSKYEYVKHYETDDRLLPGCWIVVRLDGKGFTKFTSAHGFQKPNDERGLALMNRCAQEVMQMFGDIVLAFGESDEYSFVFKKSTELYGRRSSKLVSLVTSCFTGSYVRFWSAHMDPIDLQSTPAFDSRAVLYPSDKTLRDYLAWRQADTHINNQYNTCFWKLVHSGKTLQEAQATLKGTLTDAKNELLFSFGINYNELPAMFRKGSVVIRQKQQVVAKVLSDGTEVVRERSICAVLHEDIIGDKFWQQRPELLKG